MTEPVSIIVVNWNGREYLEDCLSATLAQTYPNFEVVVVDNGSTDGSPDFITGRFPQVRLIRNAANIGFAAANNQGIEATSSPYVATLNNDTQSDPRWLEELARAIETEEQVGMVASKMVFAGRPDVIQSTGINLDRVGIAWDRQGGELDDTQETYPIEVFGACAGAALYRREMLADVGLFDEDLFLYLEDVDLAWRARLRGWRCLYVPGARVAHHHSASTGEGSPFKNRLLGRNKVWAIAKDYPSPQIWWYLPIIVAYDLAAVGYALIARRDVTPLQGRLLGLRGLPDMLAKRHVIQRRRRVTWRTMAAVMSPPESPLAVLRRYQHLR